MSLSLKSTNAGAERIKICGLRPITPLFPVDRWAGGTCHYIHLRRQKSPRLFDHCDYVALLCISLRHFAFLHPERQMEDVICTSYVGIESLESKHGLLKEENTSHKHQCFFSAGMPGSESSWNAWVWTRSLPNVWRRAVREKCPCHFGWEDSLRPVSLCFAFTASPLQDVELVS